LASLHKGVRPKNLHQIVLKDNPFTAVRQGSRGSQEPLGQGHRLLATEKLTFFGVNRERTKFVQVLVLLVDIAFEAFLRTF
jgi:hypothetical protein